jgi:hypothetical protein
METPYGWEYAVMDLAGSQTTQEAELNGMGEVDWELVALINRGDHVLAYFKRPKANPNPNLGGYE